MTNANAVSCPVTLKRGRVGRKRTKKLQAGETMPISFRLDAELAQALDEEARRLSEDAGVPVSRVDVMRKWLRKAAAERGKSRK